MHYVKLVSEEAVVPEIRKMFHFRKNTHAEKPTIIKNIG